MREVKFRAKVIRNIQVSSEGVIPAGEWITWNPLSWVPSWTAHIDRDSLRQYTGFKTDDGTDIYEQDIVRIGTEYTNLSQKNGTPVYEAVRMIHGRWEPLCFFKDGHFTVCGNVFENPELLKAGDA